MGKFHNLCKLIDLSRFILEEVKGHVSNQKWRKAKKIEGNSPSNMAAEGRKKLGDFGE